MSSAWTLEIGPCLPGEDVGEYNPEGYWLGNVPSNRVFILPEDVARVHELFVAIPPVPAGAPGLSREKLADDLGHIGVLAAKASPGPWRAMRDGNQYVDKEHKNPVGASLVEGLKRPWNRHQMLAFGLKFETMGVTRLLDEDADYIEAVQPSRLIPLLAALLAARTGDQEIEATKP